MLQLLQYFGINSYKELIIVLIKYIFVGGVVGFISTIILEKRKRFWDYLFKKKELQFAKFYEKQSEVITELFKRINAAERIVSIFLQMTYQNTSQYEDILRVTNESLFAFHSYFSDNEIYLDINIISKVNEFSVLIEKTVGSVYVHSPQQFQMYLEHGRYDLANQVSEIQKEAWNKYQQEYPLLKKALKDELKRVIQSGLNI